MFWWQNLSLRHAPHFFRIPHSSTRFHTSKDADVTHVLGALKRAPKIAGYSAGKEILGHAQGQIKNPDTLAAKIKLNIFVLEWYAFLGF